MLRIPGTPFLPGTTIRDITKTNYRRSQKFVTLNGVQMLADKPPSYETNVWPPSIYLPCEPKYPAWIVYEKQVLCFYGYFKEKFPGINTLLDQIRKVKILYYLEDGTIQVSEPRIENSGIPQGCLVSRQRVPRSSSLIKNDFISILDLNVNQTIVIFDREYHITGCDLFTRNFLNRLGIPVPDSTEDFTFQKKQIQPGRPITGRSCSTPKKSAFKQFLEYDKKILKFFGYWNDKSELGRLHKLEIFYYLADDTIEIKEVFENKESIVFLKKCKLQKEGTGLQLPTEESKQEIILNVLGSSFGKSRYIRDSIDYEKKNIYYNDSNLMIGQHLNVYGRDVVLIDCDAFTKEYYQKKYGVEEFIPIPYPETTNNDVFDLCNSKLKKHRSISERELPPWNGWGTHEDSEQNCITVEPKPPRIDINKLLKLDKHILRFTAKMISKIKENCDRKFTILYYLSDDTIQVYEIPQRNSGFIGGEFFKRSKFLLPEQNLFTSKRPEYYQPEDFYIGATVNLRNYIFHIESADEYTLSYMENHPYKFPLSNIEKILLKIRNALKNDYKNFISKYIPNVSITNGQSTMNFNQMHDLLIDLLGNDITEHEIITLCRHFSITKKSSNQKQSFDREKLQKIVHWEIQKNLWNDFDKLKEYIYHIQTRNDGFINENKLRSIILGSRLPFNNELLESILKILNRNSQNEIEICDFINFIDHHYHHNKLLTGNVECQQENHYENIKENSIFYNNFHIELIDWNKFIEKINLEENLQKETE